MDETEYIQKRQAQNILNAFDFAMSQGKAFNYFCIIHLGDTIHQASDTAFKAIMMKYRRWLAYKRKIGVVTSKPMYVFTHENPNNNPHVNWCVYIPPNIREEFEQKLPLWIEAVQGEMDDHTLRVEPLEGEGDRSVRYYIIKGIDPEHIDTFGLRKRYELKGPQGTIFGHRAGFSRCLGRAAMKKVKFNPKAYYQAYLRRLGTL